MNADQNDAPLYLQRHQPRANALRWVLALAVGTSISLGLLFLAGQSFDQLPTTSALSAAPVISAPLPVVAPVQSIQSASSREARATAAIETAAIALPAAKAPKQTVFNDSNYQPKPLVNSVAMAPLSSQSTTSSEGAGVVTGIKEKPMACWPLKEGSIEYRDCKRAVQLNSRNR